MSLPGGRGRGAAGRPQQLITVDVVEVLLGGELVEEVAIAAAAQQGFVVRCACPDGVFVS